MIHRVTTSVRCKNWPSWFLVAIEMYLSDTGCRKLPFYFNSNLLLIFACFFFLLIPFFKNLVLASTIRPMFICLYPQIYLWIWKIIFTLLSEMPDWIYSPFSFCTPSAMNAIIKFLITNSQAFLIDAGGHIGFI